MRFKKTAALLLAAAMLVSVSACGDKEEPTPSQTAEPSGTPALGQQVYTETTRGFGGDVTVTLAMEDGKIVSVTVEGPEESADYGAKAVARFNETLAEWAGKALGGVGAEDLDGYSGASVTTAAVKTALGSVLAQAAGIEATSVLADGTYTQSAWGFSLDTQLSVEVEIKDNKLCAIVPDLAGSGETTHLAQTAVDRMIPRILEEQSLAVDAVAGATSSSNAIKSAVADAIREAMKAGGMEESAIEAAMSGWYKTPSYDKSGAAAVDVQTQVLVVGGGGTGCLAALQAQATGADTLVIETSGKYGGTGALTCGPMTVNSPQQVSDFGNRELVDGNALYTQWLSDIGASEGSKAATVIDEFMAMSGYDIDWMNTMGFQKFIMSTPFKFPAYQIWCTYDGWNAGKVHGDGNTHDYFSDMMDTYAEMGGETMFETTGTAFLLDEKGNVTGVEAVGYDGQVYHIYADAVVLATGGYAGSEEYLKEFTKADELGVYQTYGVKTNVGTAITMARQVDGQIAGNVDIVMAHFSAPVQRIHEFTPEDNEIPTVLVVNENALAVNQNGERYINEVFASSDSGDETARYYAIWGSDTLDQVVESGFKGSTSGMYLNPGVIQAETPVKNLYSVLDYCVEAGFAWKADSLEALAEAISEDTGAPMTELASSTQRYNELCKAGEDKDFGKPAMYLQEVTGETYYAVEATPILYSTCASLEVDEQLRLLKNSGEAVENVFVGGMDSMGVVLADEYEDYGGVAQAWTFYSGRKCGMNAAEYALGAKPVKSEQAGITVTDLGDFHYNVTGTALYQPGMALETGDQVEDGQYYVTVSLPSPDGNGKEAVVKTVAPFAGDGESVEKDQTFQAKNGTIQYPLQLSAQTVTQGGVVLTVEWDGSTEQSYTIHTDFLRLSKESASQDCTEQVREALAADSQWRKLSTLNVGTVVRFAGMNDERAIYEISGLVSENSQATKVLGADAAEGEHYAAVLLAAPEGFEKGSFAVQEAVGLDGETMKISQSKLSAVQTGEGAGAIYLQQFLPAVYEYGGFWGGENLISTGTLSRGGVTLKGTWTAGSRQQEMEYVLLFHDLYMNFAAMDMTAELEALGQADAGVSIQAVGVRTYQVSKTGTVNVLLESPDPYSSYKAVTVNGEGMDASAGQVVASVELKPGENRVTAVWSGMDTFWGPGADYPVEYVFICE